VVSDGASCRKSGLGGANRDRSWAIQTSIVVDTFGWIGRVTSVILYQSVWTAVRTLFPALNRDVGDVTVASAETAIDHRSTGAPTGGLFSNVPSNALNTLCKGHLIIREHEALTWNPHTERGWIWDISSEGLVVAADKGDLRDTTRRRGSGSVIRQRVRTRILPFMRGTHDAEE
jgi:hypothetical protein